ncbi:MAG TPA: hypothetical protein VH207_02180 [Chthoniobacterales bacterium]|jgi:hypothetical protein|nr:hypothetical protein [Chthoniobacterales bacterium]
MKKFVALLLVLSACAADAAVMPINNPGALTIDGTIDWGPLGPPFTQINNPFTIGVDGCNLSAVVSQAGQSSFERRDQGNGWGGNFGPGEELLWTAGANGPMTLAFNSTISGIGFQIQADFFGAFTATLEAFDSSNMSLGSFMFNGNSTSDGDDSAIFIGVLSDMSDIASLSIDVSDINGQSDFAINGPLIQCGAGSVPEGGATLLLLALGGAAIFALRRSIRMA